MQSLVLWFNCRPLLTHRWRCDKIDVMYSVWGQSLVSICWSITASKSFWHHAVKFVDVLNDNSFGVYRHKFNSCRHDLNQIWWKSDEQSRRSSKNEVFKENQNSRREVWLNWYLCSQHDTRNLSHDLQVALCWNWAGMDVVTHTKFGLNTRKRCRASRPIWCVFYRIRLHVIW